MKRNIYILIIIISIGFQSFIKEKEFFHSFSGTTFPEKIGKFTFVSHKIYDEVGKDISVGYNTESRVILTHYVYPSNEQSLIEHFENYKNSLISNKNWTRVITVEDLTTKNISGKYSKFSYNENMEGTLRPVYSYLYIYETKGWFVMLRITCNKENNDLAEKDINEYIQSMPFPTKQCK
jgi:hypothetical protein